MFLSVGLHCATSIHLGMSLGKEVSNKAKCLVPLIVMY